MLCSTLQCKCANRSVLPGCNILCACFAKKGDCFQKSQEPEPELELSIHDLSIDEPVPESPRRRRRIVSSSSEASVSSKTSRIESDDDSFTDIMDLSTSQQAPVVYSSRRLTNQQRERLEPRTLCHVFITETSTGEHIIAFDNFGAIGLDIMFEVQHACLKYLFSDFLI